MNPRLTEIGKVNLVRWFPYEIRQLDMVDHTSSHPHEELDKKNILTLDKTAPKSRNLRDDPYTRSNSPSDFWMILIVSFTLLIIAVMCVCWYRHIYGKMQQTYKKYMKFQDREKATAEDSKHLARRDNTHNFEEKGLLNAGSLSKDNVFCKRGENGYCDKMRCCKLQAFLQERKKLLASENTRKANLANYESNKELRERISLNMLLSPSGQSIRSLPSHLEHQERPTGSAFQGQNILSPKRNMINIVTTFQREYSAYIKSLRRKPKNTDISKKPLTQESFPNLQPIRSCYYSSDSTFDAVKKSSSHLAKSSKWKICNGHNVRLTKSIETRPTRKQVYKSKSCTNAPQSKGNDADRMPELLTHIGKQSELLVRENGDKTCQKENPNKTAQDNGKSYECKLNENSANLSYVVHDVSLTEQSMPKERPIQNQLADCGSDASENYDELGMLFSYYMKLQARPCYRRYCPLSRHLKTKHKHDEKHCQLRCKHYRMYPYDQRPACSSGNVCRDTYDEFQLMQASAVDRLSHYVSMFRRRSCFLRQPCYSSQGTLLFVG